MFDTVIRQMRRSAIDTSPQGPIYLGYRLGHIKGERPVFRALVYNKAAMVLTCCAASSATTQFFGGLRRFYSEWRFKKAGTDDFRVAMEAATGRNLTPFFDAWIYGAAIPRLSFGYRSPDANSIVVRFEHRGDVAPVPVTVSITYMNGETQNVVVTVAERTVERTIRAEAQGRSDQACRGKQRQRRARRNRTIGFLGEGLSSGFRVQGSRFEA